MSVLESSEKHVLSSACFSSLRLLRFDQSSLAMEEVLIQGDTAGVASLPIRRGPPGAAATAACGHRAGARLAQPGGGRGA